ncbi:unnamed protein product [Moneuplotes crassus]|uniref:Serine hydrolase domain-containing protein n=1 Tax=Euplotes crassus TaxID=5936 RepID=A0AAD2D2H6_EUPCR|nr:unnamed protein product [Moneuplotes crassus]
MKHQLAYYEYILGEFIEFDYLQAPYECDEVFDPNIKEKFEGPFYRWMIFNPETKEVTGFIDSLKRIKEYYESNGPYDGIIGFSQGGYMVRTLMKADILGFPDLKLSPGFVILISSAIPYWDKIKPIIEGDYSSPVLYIYGSNDPITKPFDYCICPRSDTTVIFHKKATTFLNSLTIPCLVS